MSNRVWGNLMRDLFHHWGRVFRVRAQWDNQRQGWSREIVKWAINQVIRI
jgi:hypothetical protein